MNGDKWIEKLIENCAKSKFFSQTCKRTKVIVFFIIKFFTPLTEQITLDQSLFPKTGLGDLREIILDLTWAGASTIFDNSQNELNLFEEYSR